MVVAQENTDRQDLHLREIQELARRLDTGKLEECMHQEMEQKFNVCAEEGSIEEVMNILAKAEFVRQRMEEGVSMRDAVRELGRRIRAVQQSFKSVE